MSQAYYSNTIKDFLQEPNESIKVKLDDRSVEFSQLWTVQFTSWYSCIEILKDQFSILISAYPEAANWGILFEYEIPRLLSRIDVVVIADNLIFVIEFKLDRKTFESADIRQVEDYALDLKDFHLESKDRILIPVLLAPLAKNIAGQQFKDLDSVLQPIIKANDKNLAELMALSYKANEHSSPKIGFKEWESSIYSPTPTIIQAAQALFAGQKVEAITSRGAVNLSLTTDYLLDIIEEAKKTRRKVICFVTGVPGAGKTLVGLNVIHKEESVEQDKSNKAYFSGNGPLINVLTEALTLDEYARNKQVPPNEEEEDLNKDGIRRKIKAKIQNLHNFIKDNMVKTLAPIEQIVVFDEAQRCWDADNFYNKAVQSRERKKDDPKPIRKSEAEIIFEIMNRHNDWAVIIALIGNGQEINTGEAGISEWGRVLKEKYSNWQVHISPELLFVDAKSNNSLFDERTDDLDIQTNHSLHLSVSQRSFKANNLNEWVNAVIDNDSFNAHKLYSLIHPNFNIYITRNLNSAKDWLKKQKQGNKRIGLVASSGGLRLRPYGISTKEEFNVPYWFLNSDKDVRSSEFLEIVATEYKIQGLEIDWVGVCWDADLRRVDDIWDFKNFSGTKWASVNKEEDRQFLLNKYRVLLTRAREGMVIWVPEGDINDETRLPQLYDPIYDYLKSCGVQEI